MNLSNDVVLDLLKKSNEDIYLVGGVVRDYFLGKTTCDKDILVSNAEEFAIDFAKKMMLLLLLLIVKIRFIEWF